MSIQATTGYPSQATYQPQAPAGATNTNSLIQGAGSFSQPSSFSQTFADSSYGCPAGGSYLSYLQAPKQTLLQGLSSLAQTMTQAAKGAYQEASFNSAQGLGIRQGLSEYQGKQNLQTFLSLVDQIQSASTTISTPQQRTNSQTQTASPEQPSFVDQFGMSGQQYLLNDAKQQAMQYVLSQFGIDSSQFTATSALESIIDSVAGTSSAAGSQAGSIAANGAASSSAASGSATASATAAENTAGSTLGQVGTVAGHVLGAAGAAYSAYQMIDNWGNNTPQGGAVQGASVGAYVGTCVGGPIGTVVGGVIGGVAGAALGCIKSGKHKDQKARDAVRDHFKEIGLIDENWSLELADGSRYDIGLDGGHRYPNCDGSERAPYQLDFSYPRLVETLGWAEPLATILTGGDEKLRSDFSGYFVNAALSNATSYDTARLNVLKIFENMNITPQEAVGALVQIHQNGNITEDELLAFTNGLRCLLEGETSTGEELSNSLTV